MAAGSNGNGNGAHPPDSGDDSAERPKVPAKIPQANGGALYAGGVPGNRGGHGQPPSRVKAALRMDFEERRGVLRDIADGIVRVRLVPTSTCPECAHTWEEAPMSEADVKRQLPTVADRVYALRTMAQFSDLGDTGLPDDGLLQELGQAVVDVVGPAPWLEIERRWVDVLSRRIK